MRLFCVLTRGLGCVGVYEGRGCFVHQNEKFRGLCGCVDVFGLVTVGSLGFFQTFTL
jgi:hypothetical protein